MSEKVFFISGPDTRHDAHLWRGSDPDYPFAVGYLLAADILVNAFVEQGAVHRSTLPYPIVFNYRQHVELKFKEIIVKGRKLLGIQIDYTKKKRQDWHGHNLAELWTLAKETVNQIYEGSLEVGGYEVIDTLVKEFEELDPWGDAFRYHVDKGGTETLLGLDSFNLPRLKNEMENVADLLDGITTGISMELENRNTIEF